MGGPHLKDSPERGKSIPLEDRVKEKVRSIIGPSQEGEGGMEKKGRESQATFIRMPCRSLGLRRGKTKVARPPTKKTEKTLQRVKSKTGVGGKKKGDHPCFNPSTTVLVL